MKRLKKIGSLKYTFYILLLLAVSSVIGTIVPQGRDAAFYVHVYGRQAAKLMLFLKADDFYRSAFFYTVLFLLALNLTICVINSINRSLFRNRKKTALFLVHLSILLVFTGALVSAFTKFSDFQKLRPGEKVVLSGGVSGPEFRRFEIEYYPDSDQVKDYRSIVSLKNDDGTARECFVKVNHPVHDHGFAVYQAGFEAMARMRLTISHAGKTVWQGDAEQGKRIDFDKKHGLSAEIAEFIPDAVINGNRIELHSYRLKEAALLIQIYKDDKLISESWTSNSEHLNKIFRSQEIVFDYRIEDLRISFATVFHVLKDPGLNLVWSGFICLFVGIILFLLNKKF